MSALTTSPPTDGIGIANLPNQVHRKSVRKGFQFTAMVVGKDIYFMQCAECMLIPN